jgi:hypothetical protein
MTKEEHFQYGRMPAFACQTTVPRIQIRVDTTYQNGQKVSKLTQNIQNGYKIYQIAKKVQNDLTIYQYFPFQGPPAYTQIGIFGILILPSGNTELQIISAELTYL